MAVVTGGETGGMDDRWCCWEAGRGLTGGSVRE